MPIDSTESTELAPSESSPPASSQPFWRDPSRLLAVVAAAALRWRGLLSEEWTAIVLTAALGAPLTQAVLAAVKKVRGK